MRAFLVVSIGGALALLALALRGWLALPYELDQTRITWFMSAVLLLGLLYAAKGEWRSVRFIRDTLPYMGFAGTLTGFILAFRSIDPTMVTDVTAIGPMIGEMFAGMMTALFTSLIGIIGYLWLYWMTYLFSGDEQ